MYDLFRDFSLSLSLSLSIFDALQMNVYNLLRWFSAKTSAVHAEWLAV